MLKKTITYTDYNGVERTEDFYFNLSKAELAEMELGTAGGYAGMIQAIIDAKDQPSLVKIFKELILKAYGEKTPDGKRFVKGREVSEAFEQTEAYSSLFIELASDDVAAAEFVNGIMPADLQQQLSSKELKAAAAEKLGIKVSTASVIE